MFWSLKAEITDVLTITAENTSTGHGSHKLATAATSVLNGSKDDEHLHGDTGIWSDTAWRNLGGKQQVHMERQASWTLTVALRWFTFCEHFQISALKPGEHSGLRAHHRRGAGWRVACVHSVAKAGVCRRFTDCVSRPSFVIFFDRAR